MKSCPRQRFLNLLARDISSIDVWSLISEKWFLKYDFMFSEIWWLKSDFIVKSNEHLLEWNFQGKKRREVEKLMGDHGRSMGGHVRSVGVMGGQWVVLGGQWEVKGGSRQVTRRLLKVSGTPLQNAHCQCYRRTILKSDEIQWKISEIKN